MKFADKRFFNRHGSPERPVYKLRFSNDGKSPVLVRTGTQNWQAYIESYKDGCDIQVMINRINNGDLSPLSATSGFYGDVSDAPDSLQEALNAKLEMTRMFNALSDDQKAAFGDEMNFISSIGSESWMSIMNPNKEVPADSKEEVKSE